MSVRLRPLTAMAANGDRSGRAEVSDHQRPGQDHERLAIHVEKRTRESRPSLRFFVSLPVVYEWKKLYFIGSGGDEGSWLTL